VKLKQTNFAHLSPAKRWTVLLCFLLLGVAVVAQAFHLHPNELANNAKHCSICQVAHAPVQVVPVAQLSLSLTATAFLSLSADPDPKQGLDSFSLFCRPPPLV
jgi:hypothetical protein